MKKQFPVIVLLAATGLSGCATNSSSFRGDIYRDGSYYSPAREGQGDYYYAPEQRDYYPVPSYFHGFGPSFYSYDAYCSARYRYCPSFWSSPYDPFDWMFYSAGRGGWSPVYRHAPRHRPHREGSRDMGDPAAPPRQARADRPERPSPAPGRGERPPESRAWPREATDGSDGGGGRVRGRRGGNRGGQ